MKNKKSIKIRILKSTLMLVGVILLGIGITFNILVNSYIKNNANSELNKASKYVNNYYEEKEKLKPLIDDKFFIKENIIKLPSEDEHEINKYMSRLVKEVEEHSNAKCMIVNSNYEILFPIDNYYSVIPSDLESIADSVKNQYEDIKEVSNKKMIIKNKHYYISTLNLEKLYDDKELYTILFIDITQQLELAVGINILLFVIMFIAGLLTIFTTIILSEKISKPIKEISKFAKQIGNGDFTRSDMDFEDKELDELLNVMNKSAEYLDKFDREQKIFFQNISHELRTPLMSIVSYAEAIKYNIMESEKASEIILDEGEKLKEMIEELLYISKIDNITKDYKLSNCDLREVLSNCIQSKQATAISKNIKFTCDFSKESIMYLCDEKNISRVFLNIIDNALRYAKSEIFIVCKLDKPKIIITIEDDGNGIKEDDMPYIFDRYYKGDKGKNGIGLSIVKSIVNNHDGKIYCENTKKGAKFIIEFVQTF